MKLINQSATNDSYTLLKKGVLAIFLSSSSSLGGETLGRATWCSIFQERGYCAECVIELNIYVAGGASRSTQFCTSFFGRSPDTIPWGFLALISFFLTVWTSRRGAYDMSGASKALCILGGRDDICKGGYSWLIFEKCGAMTSTDYYGVSPCVACDKI